MREEQFAGVGKLIDGKEERHSDPPVELNFEKELKR